MKKTSRNHQNNWMRKKHQRSKNYTPLLVGSVVLAGSLVALGVYRKIYKPATPPSLPRVAEPANVGQLVQQPIINMQVLQENEEDAFNEHDMLRNLEEQRLERMELLRLDEERLDEERLELLNQTKSKQKPKQKPINKYKNDILPIKLIDKFDSNNIDMLFHMISKSDKLVHLLSNMYTTNLLSGVQYNEQVINYRSLVNQILDGDPDKDGITRNKLFDKFYTSRGSDLYSYRININNVVHEFITFIEKSGVSDYFRFIVNADCYTTAKSKNIWSAKKHVVHQLNSDMSNKSEEIIKKLQEYIEYDNSKYRNMDMNICLKSMQFPEILLVKNVDTDVIMDNTFIVNIKGNKTMYRLTSIYVRLQDKKDYGMSEFYQGVCVPDDKNKFTTLISEKGVKKIDGEQNMAKYLFGLYEKEQTFKEKATEKFYDVVYKLDAAFNGIKYYEEKLTSHFIPNN